MQSSQTEEAIFNHVFVHFLHKFLVISWLLELGLIDPVEGLKTSAIQVLNINLYHRTLCTKVLHLQYLLLVSIRWVEVESLVHQILFRTFRLFFLNFRLLYRSRERWLVLLSWITTSIIQCLIWLNKSLGITAIWHWDFCWIENIAGPSGRVISSWMYFKDRVIPDVWLLNRDRRAVTFGL